MNLYQGIGLLLRKEALAIHNNSTGELISLDGDGHLVNRKTGELYEDPRFLAQELDDTWEESGVARIHIENEIDALIASARKISELSVRREVMRQVKNLQRALSEHTFIDEQS